MGYLTPNDYKKTIQADNLQQVIAGDITILEGAEALAIEEAASHLVQKYVTDREFQDVLKWLPYTNDYQAFDRVYITAPLFSITQNYALGDYVTYAPTGQPYKKVYRSANIVAPGAFDPGSWVEICNEYDIFTPTLPAPEFNYLTKYKIGDVVVWNDDVYTCRIASGTISQELALQYGTYQAIPRGNVFPNDPVNGLQYWGAAVPFVMVPGEPGDNDAWIKGDPRSKQVVKAVVDLAIYYIHDRIAPRNVPEQRRNNYLDSIDKLKGFAEGDTTNIKLPLIQPKQGKRIRFGGNVKNTNTY